MRNFKLSLLVLTICLSLVVVNVQAQSVQILGSNTLNGAINGVVLGGASMLMTNKKLNAPFNKNLEDLYALQVGLGLGTLFGVGIGAYDVYSGEGKDMIVSGGENIYPAEVENALMSHPEIADAAVIGVPDDKWGESVKGFVVLQPDSSLDETEIISYTRTQIAGYKCPKTINFIEALPRNPSGKILRRELREPFWEGKDRMVSGN